MWLYNHNACAMAYISSEFDSGVEVPVLGLTTAAVVLVSKQ